MRTLSEVVSGSDTGGTRLLDNAVRSGLGSECGGVEAHLDALGRLVSAIDTGDTGQLVAPCLRVEAFGAAFLATGRAARSSIPSTVSRSLIRVDLHTRGVQTGFTTSSS